MEDEGPVLARVLGTRRGRRLALAIEAELVALVAAAAAPHADDGSGGPEAEKPRRARVCVVFAGLGGYGRLLVHKTAERFEGLESFSIGDADNRRTVVLAAHSQPTAAAAPFLRYADFVAKAPPPTQRPTPAAEAIPGDPDAAVPASDEARGEPPSTAGARGPKATARPAREPRGVYVPPSRRDPATAVGVGGRSRGGLYVPPARRHRDEVQAPAADSGREVLAQEEEQEHTTKRRRERSVDEETTSTTRTATTKVDEELEEVLDRHDAELKPLVDEAAFAEWAAASAAAAAAAAGEGGRRGSPGRSSPDPWASLNRGRRDRRAESRRSAHEEEPDPEVVVCDYPAHVVELYDVEPSITDQELASLLFGAADTTGGFAGRLRRVDHTTALAVFGSRLEAQEAMVRHTTTTTTGGQFKLRPLAEASPAPKAIRGVALEVPKCVVPRPPTDARVARRMLAHALGLSPKRQNTTDD